MTSLTFFVAGEPIPQGSTKSFYIKKLDRVVTTHGNKSTEGWRQRIATEAQAAAAQQGWEWSDDRRVGYVIEGTFHFIKPKSTPKCVKLNTKRPDLDKLIRATLDAVTEVLYPDDAQVIKISMGKDYVENGAPGLEITVRRVVE